MGDGATLYFDFAKFHDADPALILSSLYLMVNQLRTKLDQTVRTFRLTITFPVGFMLDSAGIYGVPNVKKFLDHVDRFLVVLDDPVETSTKTLRHKIEKHVVSEVQLTLVRKIIPVISSDGPVRQLRARITSFDDNFGEEGMWIVQIGQGKRCRVDPSCGPGRISA